MWKSWFLILVLLSFFLNLAASSQTLILDLVSPREFAYAQKEIGLEWTSSEMLSWCYYSLNGMIMNHTICKIQNVFNDSLERKNVSFGKPSFELEWVEIPKDSRVEVASLKVRGYKIFGDGWKELQPLTSNTIYSIELEENIGFMVGYGGVIFKWDGKSWKEEESPTTNTLHDVAIFNESLAFAVGSKGTILKWDGNYWNLDVSPLSTTLYSIDFGSSSLAFAGDLDGRIISWNGSWYNESTPLDPAVGWGLTGISLTNSTFGFGVAVGHMLRWDGSSWSIFDSYVGIRFEKIKLVNSTLGFAVESLTSDKELWKWNGSSWSYIPTQGTDGLYGIDVEENLGYAVGLNGRIVKWDGKEWKEDWSPVSANLYAIGVNGRVAFSSGEGGKLIENGGFPEKIGLDLASSLGEPEWYFADELNLSNSPQMVNLNVTLINRWLKGCQNQVCGLEFNFSTGSIGILEISDLNLIYSQNITVQAPEGRNKLSIWGRDLEGYENSSEVEFLVDLTPPTFLSIDFWPPLLLVGENVSLKVEASDNLGLKSIGVNISNPLETLSIFLLNNVSANYTTSVIGTHNLTFFALDEAGNLAIEEGSFEVRLPVNLRLNVIDSNLSFLTGKMKIYLPEQLRPILSTTFDKEIDMDIPENLFVDLELDCYFDTFKIRFNRVNGLANLSAEVVIDKLKAFDFLVIYAINTTIPFAYATLQLNYSQLDYLNENYLEVYRCVDWNFGLRSCQGAWERIDVVQIEEEDLLLLNVSNFSAFSVKQGPFCGDGVKNVNEECDGNDFGGLGCRDFRFDFGDLRCRENCTIDTSGCSYLAEVGEVLEGFPTILILPPPPEPEEPCEYNFSCTEWSPCTRAGISLKVCFHRGACPRFYDRYVEKCVYRGICGDGICELEENCESCAVDCGICPFCGDGICQADENCEICPTDCGRCPLDLRKFAWLIPVSIIALGFAMLGKIVWERVKIKRAKEEKKWVLWLMKEAQMDYYHHERLSKEEYEAKMSSYRKRLEKINEWLRKKGMI